MLIELCSPNAVVDVGCGIGTWCRVFAERGVRVLGIDGNYIDRGQLLISPAEFLARDLAKPIDLVQSFDLAICLEVAEHLPPTSASSFVASLTRLAPVVAFSAAVPGQGGVRHLNEQWPEYWADLFARQGYVAIDCIRDKIWTNERIVWHYRQNMLLFVQSDALDGYPRLQAERNVQGVRSLSVVHPDMYQGLLCSRDPQQMSFFRACHHFATALAALFRRKFKS